jgi:hypothetical protein
LFLRHSISLGMMDLIRHFDCRVMIRAEDEWGMHPSKHSGLDSHALLCPPDGSARR